MDFFRSLNEVRRNSGQLDRWENQQRDKDAQRKAYQAKHAPTPEEIERAKELGETLINVIDVMDDHSESVAENVETATEGISNIAVLAGGIGAGFLAWNLGIKPANKNIKAAAEAFDKDQKNIDFAEKLTKEAKFKRPNGEIVNGYVEASDLRSDWDWTKRRLASITDDNLKHQTQEINKSWQNSIKGFKRNRKLAIASVPLAALTAWVAGNIFTTKLQVDSSRIARFQARRELRDPKAFVNYTPEQIAEAKAELEKHPEKLKKKRKDNLKKGFLPSIREILKDRDNYNQTKKLRDQKQSMVERPLTEAEIQQAKKDQEVIQRVVKHINNEAEKNSEKMEVAANVIMNVFPIVSGAVGGLLTLGLEKTGLMNKWLGKYVEKHGTEEAKAAFKEFIALDKKDPKYNAAWRDFFGEITGMPMNKKQLERKAQEELKRDKARTADALGNVGKKAKKDITSMDRVWRKTKDLFVGGVSHSRWGGKTIIGFAAGILASFPSAIIALKLQKNAARAGRYTAKRELEKDPTNFIGYSQEELDEVKDVKNETKKGSKFKEYALFIPNVLRDYFRYEKYKNKEYKKQQALNAELKKLDVSEEQLRDAKNLQAKVFNTFEKVDDKSQAYSEATEAAIETSQPLVYGAGYLLAASPLILFGYRAAKGKYTPAKLTERITNFFATSGKVMKSKLFKGYLKGVEKHTATVVANTDTTNKTVSAMMKDIDIMETPITEIFNKGVRNLRNHLSTSLHGMDEAQQRSKLFDIHQTLIKTLYSNPYTEKTWNKEGYQNISRIFWKLEEIKDATVRADIFDIITMNKDVVSKMPQERFTAAMEQITQNFVSDKHAQGLADLMQAGRELQAMFTNKILGMPEVQDVLKKLPKDKVDEALNTLTKFDIPDKNADEIRDFLTQGIKDKNLYLNIVDKLPQPSIINLPLRFKDMPELADSIANVAKGIASAGKIADLTTGSKAGSSKLMKILDNADAINNPKAAMEKLAKYLEELDNEAYVDIVRRTPVGGWERENVVKTIKNLAKMYDNIPKEELKRIQSTLIKQFQENPDKFYEAVKSGKIMQIFWTPQLQKALAVAGVSWLAFTAITTYAIESWLAEIQLRAGRLGVKSAMDDLQDHRYYANVIPTEENVTKTPEPQTNDLLAKFKK
ncbi:MAG: hypothetical protein NC390_06475 [Fusobacterium sp.]|nr:hypothetical protein [Fusobacterium sp.]